MVRRLCEIAQSVSLGLWAGWLGATGAAAAVLFPTMRDVDPVLPQYDALPGDHWRLAAGFVGERLFDVANWVQVLFGVLALVTIPFTWTRGWRSLVRVALILVGVGAIVFQVAILDPRMDDALHAYREAAATGDVDTATAQQQAFDRDHPIASRAITISFASALLAFVIGLADRRDPGV